jgi:hypothetical protein
MLQQQMRNVYVAEAASCVQRIVTLRAAAAAVVCCSSTCMTPTACRSTSGLVLSHCQAHDVKLKTFVKIKGLNNYKADTSL